MLTDPLIGYLFSTWVFLDLITLIQILKVFRYLHTDPDDQYKLTEDTRQLGLVVCRGTSVVLICPQDGMESIPNPFIQQQDG